jgi:hypothetical protein
LEEQVQPGLARVYSPSRDVASSSVIASLQARISKHRGQETPALVQAKAGLE